jgi:response regulator NasT
VGWSGLMDKESILIAHSQLEMRKKLCKMLGQKGYITYQASDGPSTLRSARSLHPTLVLIDLKITGMSPYKVAETVEKNYLSTVLFMVKQPSDYFLKKIETLNVYAYVIKPIQKSQLERAVVFSIKTANNINQLRQEIKNLELTLEKREIINHGKGIIMKDFQLNEGDAYGKLRKLSMDHCLNLVDTSKKIIAQYS